MAISLNGQPTNLTMQLANEGTFTFSGGGLCPEAWLLSYLPLKEGRNQLEYVLDGGGGVSADLWLWDATDKVVIFDIDGTITKSDVRGLVANQLQVPMRSHPAEYLICMLGPSWSPIPQPKSGG